MTCPPLAPDEVRLLERFVRVLELEDEKARARVDPAFLISFMSAPDERTAETFSFAHMREPLPEGAVVVVGNALHCPAGDWSWQRAEVESFEREQRLIRLKARQLGETWICCGYVTARCLSMPGSLHLIYRQKEEEAVENVRRCWALFQSLPRHLRMDVEVLTPARGSLPSTEIKLRFPDGSISRIAAMSSASASGHGKTAATILLDEHSRIDRAGEIMKAVQPAAGSKGKIIIISTANGRSNPETGDGNVFHWLWENAESAGFSKRFLPWSLHPDRDQDWYDHDPEVRGLKQHERAEQYPANEREAFTLTNRVFFEVEDLDWYSENAIREPLYRLDFVDPADRLKLVRGAKAAVRRHDRGLTHVFEEPVPGHRYAIGADVATGRGRDYSAAYVLDMATMAVVAEFHGRLDEDLYAAQLHYLGRMYGRDVPADPKVPGSLPGFARLAVETGGGYGNAVIAALRDRTAGRPAYGNLYHHVLDNRSDRPSAKPWGFPMNMATRPKVINGIDRALRERAVPFLTNGLWHELGDFVHKDHGTSPAAADGATDDRVMAFGIALELYRLYGAFPDKPSLKPRRGKLVGLGRR